MSERKFQFRKKTYKEFFGQDEIDTNLADELMIIEEDEKLDIDHIESNGILIANFKSYKDLKDYIDTKKPKINYVTFGKNNINLDASNYNNLNIVKNNKYNELITGFWGIDEEMLYELLKIAKIENTPRLFSNMSGIYADRNKKITETFSILNTTINRNNINSIRNKSLNKEIKAQFNEYYSENLKLNYLSKIIFKKYIMLMYDIEKKEVERAKQLFKYNYFIKCIKNETKLSYHKLLEEAEKETNRNFEDLILNNEFMNCIYLEKIISNMFTSDTFEYKEVIDKIKNLFSKDFNFRNFLSPINILCSDLIELELSFDREQVEIIYYKELPKNIRMKYEIRFLQCKLINEYKDMLLNKIKNVKEREKENSENDIFQFFGKKPAIPKEDFERIEEEKKKKEIKKENRIKNKKEKIKKKDNDEISKLEKKDTE